LRQVLLAVVTRYARYKSDLSQLVEANDDLIPQSFRSFEIKQLIADVACNIYNLVHDNKLDQQAKPVLYLDKKQPGWRDTFPLPVDDQVAISLLEILLKQLDQVLEDRKQQSAIQVTALSEVS
ncbi:MAG: hypothetical protein ACWA5R_13145, partial [bacterium]